MVKYEIKINSKSYPFTDLEATRSYKIEPQAFTVTIPDGGDVFTLDDYCEIYRDDVLWFKGRIKKIRKLPDNRLELSGFDQLHSAKKLKAVNRVEPNVAAGTQINNQLSGTDLTAGTIQAGDTISMEYGSDDESRFERLRVLQELIFVEGYELYRSPSGVVDFKSTCGTDRSATVVFKKGDLLKQWADPHTTDNSQKVSRIVVIGKGQGDYMTYGIAGGAVGSPEKVINRKNLVTDDTCTKAATALLADFQNNVEHGTIEVTDTFTGLAYDVYDTIKAIDSEVGVNKNFRIAEITKKFNVTSGEQTLIKICTLTHITSNTEFLVDTGEGTINDLERNNVTIPRTEQDPHIGDLLDTTAPVTPTGLVAAGILSGIYLEWTKNTEADLAYYEVYKNSINNSGTATLIGTSDHAFCLIGLTSSEYGLTRYFWIKAVDCSGNKSGFSLVASAASLQLGAIDLKIAEKPWNADAKFWYADPTYTTIYWAKGSDENANILVIFADGTMKTITKGNTVLSAAIHYFYFDNTSSMQHTANIMDAIGEGKGLLAIIQIESGNPPTILPFNSYTPTIGSGVIAAKAVLANHIKAGAVTALKLGLERISSQAAEDALGLIAGNLLWRSDVNQLRFKSDVGMESILKEPITIAPAENLARNDSFELKDVDGKPVFWNDYDNPSGTGSHMIETNDSYKGKQCLKVTADTISSNYGAMSKEIAVTPDNTVLLQVYAKPQRSTNGDITLKLHCYDKNMSWLGMASLLKQNGLNTTWQKYSFTKKLSDVSINVRYVKIELACDTPTVAAAYVLYDAIIVSIQRTYTSYQPTIETLNLSLGSQYEVTNATGTILRSGTCTDLGDAGIPLCYIEVTIQRGSSGGSGTIRIEVTDEAGGVGQYTAHQDITIDQYVATRNLVFFYPYDSGGDTIKVIARAAGAGDVYLQCALRVCQYKTHVHQ